MNNNSAAKAKARTVLNRSKLIIITLVVFVVFKVLRPHNFGTAANIRSYIQQALIPSVAAFGLYYVVTMGLFDFSIGANIVLSGIIGIFLANSTGYFGFILGPIVIGTLIGLANGIIYIKLKIPSIIVTVGLMILYECIGAIISSGKVLTLPTGMSAFGHAPWNVIVLIIGLILTNLILRHTRVGIYSNAIGSNESVARATGINVNKYKVIAFMLAGFFTGLNSILTVSYGSAITSATNMSSMSRSFTPLMGCFFALAFANVMNPFISIMLGELIISMIMNGLITLGIPTTLQNVVIGVTLITIILLTTRVDSEAVVK